MAAAKLTLLEGTTPATPSTGFASMFFGTDKKPYFIDETGAVFPFSDAQRVVVIADATSITMNADTTDVATQANTQSVGTLTINAPTGTLVNEQKISLRLTSTNVQTFSFNAIFRGSTQLTLPATSSGSSKEDRLLFIYNSTAAKWDLVAVNFGF